MILTTLTLFFPYFLRSQLKADIWRRVLRRRSYSLYIGSSCTKAHFRFALRRSQARICHRTDAVAIGTKIDPIVYGTKIEHRRPGHPRRHLHFPFVSFTLNNHPLRVSCLNYRYQSWLSLGNLPTRFLRQQPRHRNISYPESLSRCLPVN